MPAAIDGESGGLLLAKVGNFTCPAGVSQFQTDEYGHPLTFTPVNPASVSSYLHIMLTFKFSGNPGSKTLDNWFKIEKTKDGYKFVFCPSVCSTCKVMCKDLGIVLDGNGMQRLAVSKDPLYSKVLDVPGKGPPGRGPTITSYQNNGTGPNAHTKLALGITQLQAKKHGLPLTFAPVNPKKRWEVCKEIQERELDNWFKVEKTEDGYKFVFCPTVCSFCKVLCRDVGIFVDDRGNRRLALSDVPYSVHFYR
ncbi:proteinase inhibitor I3 [Tanacetum coccineum]